MNAFFAAIALSNLVHADPQTTTESFAVGVYPKAHVSKLSVMVDNARHQRLSLRLINPRNEVLYQETVGRKLAKYGRNLDLTNLPDGVYQIQVSDGHDTVVREFSLSTQTPEPVLPAKQISLR
jgi:hypothetical protein